MMPVLLNEKYNNALHNQCTFCNAIMLLCKETNMLLTKTTMWTPILGKMLTCQAASFASIMAKHRHNATKSLDDYFFG